jgi:hypothetical protein
VYVEKCVLETGFVQQQSLNAVESGLLVQFLKPAAATQVTVDGCFVEPDRRTGGGISGDRRTGGGIFGDPSNPQIKAGAGYNSLNVLFPPPNSLLTKYMVSK